MSMYSYQFQMLPRPPRDAFSSGSEVTRATLPDFANVTELSHFVNSLFDVHLRVHAMVPQTIATTSFIFFMVIVVGLILARRIYEGKFWLVRVIRRSSGVIVVPNPIVTFLLTAGLFGCIFFPFFISLCHRFTHITLASPTNIVLWITLPWIVLVYGVIWATIGTYYATPDTFFSASSVVEDAEKDSFSLKRLLGNAKVINTMTLSLPVLATIAIATPSFIAHRIWGEALHLEEIWQLKYSESPTFNQEMVQESQFIWYTRLRAAKAGTVVFILYTIIAFAMTFAYVPIAIRLVMAVRKEIKGVKKHLDALQSTQQGQSTVRISRIIREALEANARPPRGVLSRSNSMDTSRMTSQSHINRHPAGWSQISHQVLGPSADEGVEDFKSIRKQTEDLLHSALRHIYIQAIAISLGMLDLACISLSFSLTLYGKMEQPSRDGATLFEHHIGPIWISLLYTSCVFGGLSVFAVAYKTYEPVFNTSSSSSANQVRESSTATHIGFKDVMTGLRKLCPATFPPIKEHRTGSSVSPRVKHRFRTRNGARLAYTVPQESPCITIVEEKTYLASRLQSGAEDGAASASPCVIEPYRLISSEDTSVGSSSPYSIFKHF